MLRTLHHHVYNSTANIKPVTRDVGAVHPIFSDNSNTTGERTHKVSDSKVKWKWEDMEMTLKLDGEMIPRSAEAVWEPGLKAGR